MKPIISAPLNVVTGTLGSGKTLFAIQQADLLIQSKQAAVVYQLGINNPDLRKLPALPFPIEEWYVRADRGELKNAVIIVDEMHRYLPQRGPGRPPRWIEELAESRRRDVRWIFLTQSGEFDHFLKGTRLNKHYFLSRKGFLPRSTIYEWSEKFVSDPTNLKSKKDAVITLWRHPKKYYGWYDSASAHRMRIRLPLRAWLVPVAVLAGIYFVWRGLPTLTGMLSGKGLSVVSSRARDVVAEYPRSDVVPVASSSAFPTVQPDQPRVYTDPGEYLYQFHPLVPHQPWSAPAYNSRPVVSVPEVYCMSSGWDGSESCTCLTEQGTPYAMPGNLCRDIARNGNYNPYRPPLQTVLVALSGDSSDEVVPVAH